MRKRRNQKSGPSGHRPNTASGPHLAGTLEPTPVWHRWLPALLVAAGILVYINSFGGVFLFDDSTNIVRNPHIRRLWPLWDTLIHSRRRPVVNLSLAINYALGELQVWGYHAFNLAVHLLAGLTLFGIIRRTLLLSIRDKQHRQKPPSPSQMAKSRKHAPYLVPNPPFATWFALIVALIWVVHPLQTQSVTYIIQRSEALMGLFYLLTLYGLLRGSDSRHRYLWYTATVVACALGMGTKAVMLTAPVVVLLFDGVLLAGSFRDALTKRWGLYIGLAATWSVLLVTGVAQSVLLPPPNSLAHVGFGYSGITPIEYALSQPGVLLHYLRLAIWPEALCFDYGWPVAKSLSAIAAPAAVILTLLIGTFWALRRRPRLGLAAACFFLILAPTSSFVPIKDLAVEHRMYLPLASVVILSVASGYVGLGYLFERFSVARVPRRLLTAALVLAVVAPLSYATAQRNKDYRSEVAMWRKVAAQRPKHARAHANLAAALIPLDRFDEAIKELHIALRLDPLDAHSHTNLGAAWVKTGKINDAIDELHTALRLDPREVTAYFHLGEALSKSGKFAEAVEQFRTGLAIDPTYPTPYCNLGNALVKLDRTDEAIEAFGRALRIDPDHLLARFNLANTLFKLGRFEEAIEQYRHAIAIDPTYADARTGLGNALLSLGRTEEAINAYRLGLRYKPDHPLAYYNLGNALASIGKYDQAVEAYQNTLRINPRFTQGYANLGNAYFELGKIDQAVEAYRQAIQSDPRNANAHLNLAVALQQQGKLDAAIQEFRTALGIEPANATVRQALAAAVALRRRGGSK